MPDPATTLVNEFIFSLVLLISKIILVKLLLQEEKDLDYIANG